MVRLVAVQLPLQHDAPAGRLHPLGADERLSADRLADRRPALCRGSGVARGPCFRDDAARAPAINLRIAMADKLEPKIVLTDAPDPADTAVVQEGLRAYNTSQAGYDDYRPLAVFVTDPVSGKVLGGLYGGSYLGQLRVDRFFLPEDLRRDRLGSRLLAMAEEEGRRRGCTRLALDTMEIQAPGVYVKKGYEMAARLHCEDGR